MDLSPIRERVRILFDPTCEPALRMQATLIVTFGNRTLTQAYDVEMPPDLATDLELAITDCVEQLKAQKQFEMTGKAYQAMTFATQMQESLETAPEPVPVPMPAEETL